MNEAPAPWGKGDTIRRFGDGLCADGAAETTPASAEAAPPAWLAARAAPEAPIPPLSPSRAVAAREGERARVAQGRLAHALLQMLPDLPPERRPAAARAYLDAQGGALSEPARGALAAQVAAVIEAPELAPLFGPGSRGEVSLAGVLRRTGRPDLPYSGRLDRMLVNDDAVTIADFKLGARPGSGRGGACRPACALSRSVAAALPFAAGARRARLSRRGDAAPDRRCGTRRVARSRLGSEPSKPRRGLFCLTYAYSVSKRFKNGALMRSHFVGRFGPDTERVGYVKSRATPAA